MIDFITGVFVGMGIISWLIVLVLRHYELSRKMPLRWTCPEENCGFTVGSTGDDPKFILMIAERHESAHESDHDSDV